AERRIAQAGGAPADRAGPYFLAPAAPAARVVLDLSAGSCWLVLGLAGNRIADLDMYVHDAAGRRVGVNLERDAYPTVVLCPAGDRRVAAAVTAVNGAGEAFIGVYRFPGSEPPDASSLGLGELRGSGAGAAAAAEPFEETIERMDRRMIAEGFRRSGEPEMIRFEGPRGHVMRSRSVEAGACLGVALVAASAGNVDLDIEILVGGRKVAEDRETDRDAHVTWCADGFTDVRVKVGSYRGEAEGWMAFYEASAGERVFFTPRTLPDEPRAGTRGTTFEQSELDIDRSLRAAGYSRHQQAIEGMLGLGEHGRQRLQLSRGDCCEIRGLARPDGIRDLDLTLTDPDGAQVAQDRAADNAPRISYCPTRSGEHTLGIHAYDGGGGYVVHVYRMSSDMADLPGVGGRVASAYARLGAELRLRGFSPVGVPDRHPADGRTQRSHPVRLAHGRCYVVAALASGEEMDVDVEVRDYMGRAVSVDNGREPDARVFVCPVRTAPHTATVTAAGPAGAYVLAVFENKGE
ncbi:MAG: hypothetical protein QME96_10530, partial [Myxococcota bacterium]|nr:hypothetical protein [Myxococcota bacterium]